MTYHIPEDAISAATKEWLKILYAGRADAMRSLIDNELMRSDMRKVLEVALPYLAEEFLRFHVVPSMKIETTQEQANLIRMAQATAWEEGKYSVHTPKCRWGTGDCVCPNPYRDTPEGKENDANRT